MNTFVFSAHAYETPYLQRAAAGKHALVLTPTKLSIDTAGLASGCEAVALFTADDASRQVLQALAANGIRYITLRSAGYDHVDLKQAQQLRMRVANVPAYSPYSVAEHAVALLLTLNRKIIESQHLLSLHDFRLDTLVGFDIHGKTVGVIGTGTIGMAFAKIMHGFGANLLGYDPVWHAEAASINLRYVSLDELYASSDIISIHCPLNAHTHYLIAKPQLQKMKKGCILINTARGGVVCTEHLLDALQSEHLAGAGLDVYENEKDLFFENHQHHRIHDALFNRLRAQKNVVLTGHQAFLTHEALQGIADTTIKNLDYWSAGHRSVYELV